MRLKTVGVPAMGMLMVAGCHPRFKKHAASLGDIRPDVVNNSGPHANLGMIHEEDSSLVGDVVNVVQAVKGMHIAGRLGEAVEPAGVNDAFASGFSETLGAGPPFGVTDDPGAPVMQVEVLSYGLDVASLGAQGVFTYDLRVKIYRSDGYRVYKARHSCASTFGQASAVSRVLNTVNNVKQLNQMTDAQVQEIIEGTAYYCGQDLVARMRRHASSNKAPEPSVASVDRAVGR